MDFSPVDLALQDPSKASGLGIQEADSSMSHHCLSQLSFESGLAERMTNFTDGWSVNNTRSKFMNDVGNQRVCHEVEAFEGPARGTTHGLGHERDEGGHVQQDDSSSSEQTAALQNRAGQTSGKRKAAKGLTTTSTNSAKISKGDENTAKCPRTDNASKGFDEVKLTAERSTSEHSGDLSPKSLKASSKLQELHPKQDYIHVRARRGQATDSHSLAERVRREKISERMKFLQDLVPGCSKVTGKAVMLDEIINYVQSLQRQIEFLSMKLAAVDPRLDMNLENLLNKELAQARSPETTLMGPDPLAGYRDYQSHLQIQQQINNCNMDLRSVGTLCDAYLRRSMNAPVLSPLAYTDNFVDSLSQTLTGVYDGDLQTIVHMSNSQGRQEFFGQSLHGPGFLSPGFLKVEY